MSVIDTLITNRTQADISAVSALINKIIAGTATEAELELYNAAKSKGAYNYTDLNRVGEAVEYLADTLKDYGYLVNVNVKTDWMEHDSPTDSQMAQYLQNVFTVYNTILTEPELPATIKKLTVVGANQIEQTLVTVQQAINQIVAAFARSNSFTFWSGNRPFPTAKSARGRTWEELDKMEVPWTNLETADWYLLAYGNLRGETT